MKRRFIALSLFLILVAPALVAFAPDRQGQPNIQLAISAGYNGYFARGQVIPVRIIMNNTGDTLEGEVRVRTGGAGGLTETIYRLPVSLSQGSPKRVFLYVSLANYTQRLQVEVVDRAANVISRQSTTLRMLNRGEILGVVVTDSAWGVVDLMGLTPGPGRAYQIEWRSDDIPPVADALVGIDVLMFHDVNTGTLQVEQVTAIADWVLSGGHLIVTGGDAWQRTTAAFHDLLPVTLRGNVDVDSLAPLADYLRLSSEILEEPATATDTLPNNGARVLVSADGIPLIVRGTVGAGVVDFLAVDPNAEPLRSWSEQKTLWYTLLSSTGQQPSWSQGFANWTTAREATLTTSSTVLPTFVQLCGFLTLYVALIGPANYLALKWLKRREWAWFTIPFLILVFSVLAYTVGFNLRGNVATINRLTVIRAWAGDDRAQVMSLIGVQSPRRGAYDIAVERGYMLRTLPEVGIGLNVPATITEGTRYTADTIPIDAGTIASFVTNGYITTAGLDASATWYLSATQLPRIEGRITNNLEFTLHDAVILIKGESRLLGSLSPGQTVTFDIGIGPQDPGPLTLGNPLIQYTPYYINPWQYSSAASSWCFTPSGLMLTLADVMRSEPFSCAVGRTIGREQEIRQRYRLLASVVADVDLSGGRGLGAYLFAWSDQPLVEVELTGRPQSNEDTTLHIIELPVSVIAQDEVIEVSPGLTTWMIVETHDPDTLVDAVPSKIRIGSTAQAAFGFMPMPGIRLATVEELIIRFQALGPLRLDLWDWADRVWEPVALDASSTTTRVTDAARFVGPENLVNVRIVSEDGAAYAQVEYVRIAYRGRLAD